MGFISLIIQFIKPIENLTLFLILYLDKMLNNKLKNQRCYLAGAIDRVPDRGTQWRDFISPFLENLGIQVFNPLKKPTNIGAEDQTVALYKKQLKKDKRYNELSELMRTIRSVDLRMVDISDFLIVNLDIETHPCGTLEEIFWANRQKKPILVHMVQGKNNAPDWLFGTIPHSFIFDNWDAIMSYLLEINNSSIPDKYRRWVFFNNYGE
jgi:nucleoside 2-deoxyribosyltransferase